MLIQYSNVADCSRALAVNFEYFDAPVEVADGPDLAIVSSLTGLGHVILDDVL